MASCLKRYEVFGVLFIVFQDWGSLLVVSETQNKTFGGRTQKYNKIDR